MTEIVFSEQVRVLHGPLWHIAWAILRNGADCDDAIQETWLRAWNRIGNLRDETAFDAGAHTGQRVERHTRSGCYVYFAGTLRSALLTSPYA